METSLHSYYSNSYLTKPIRPETKEPPKPSAQCTVHTRFFPKTDTPKNQNRKTANRRPFIPHLILSANACLYYCKNKQITQENHAARSPLIKKKRTALNTAHTIFRKTAVHCALCTHHTSQTKPQRCVCTNCQK